MAPEYAGHFLNLLGSGKDFGAKFSYEIQDEPRGLADAFIVGENFIGRDKVAMILGDNIFDHNFTESIKSFESGGKIFAKEVPDPERFGVVEFDDNHNVISIFEKPEQPKSNFAVVGLYLYDNRVIQYAKELQPSDRGEIEITDINNRYLKEKELKVDFIEGVWQDAGTFDSLLEANKYWQQKSKEVSQE
jgi:glucose-1-phosphate thymidylyltransferase